MSLLVKNARITNSARVFTGDLLIENGIFSRVGKNISPGEARVIDAEGKFLLPGGVDVHTHFDLDTGSARASDDFFSGGAAAACGGVTSIVDHIGFGPKGCALGHQINVYRRLAERSPIDYGFHGVVQHVDDAVLRDMERLVAQGVSSCKLYLTYGYKLDDAAVLSILVRARELGMMVCVHCENDAAIQFLAKRLLAEGKGAARHHAESRPAACEAEAVWRMLMLARMAGDAPLYLVHLSSALGLEAACSARRSGQRRVFVETCPQYLMLDESRYDDDREGLKYVISPPLRSREDVQAMWRGVCDGSVDVIATDHCPFPFESQKLQGLGNFTRCPNGAPGVETRLRIMFSEGFMKGRMTLPEVVQACCSRPARLFGMYPQKGDIVPGGDADFVLFDPDVHGTITHGDLHENIDYTPYEGLAVQGAPVLTVSRGEIIAKNGVFLGAEGRGRFIARRIGDFSSRE